MSGGLVPSKSTVYVGNLPFSLTNNDLHQIFEKYGKVVKVTILKDKTNRQSKGVAFVLFIDRESAYRCIRALDKKELFGRTIKCSIARDNGRASEFIRRKIYKDKSRCYECGESGHLSYECPNNVLGEREPPKKKEKKRKRKQIEIEEEEYSDEDEGEDPALESLSSAIQYQQQLVEEEKRKNSNTEGAPSSSSCSNTKKLRFRQSSYFSDEEEIEDN